jgi:hypothetical protein
MLLYIIDAFNLAHKIPSIRDSSTPHRDLVHYIKSNKLTGSRNNQVTLVFDGYPDLNNPPAREYKIFYSQDRSADSLIIKLASNSKNKSETVIVSDDRELRDFAKKSGARSCRIAEFLKVKRKKSNQQDKDISYSLEREITEELRDYWSNNNE